MENNWRDYLPAVTNIPDQKDGKYRISENDIVYEGGKEMISSIEAYFEHEIVYNQCLHYNHVPKLAEWYIQIQLFEEPVLNTVRKYSVDLTNN